jgi:hypothetical protein
MNQRSFDPTTSAFAVALSACIAMAPAAFASAPEQCNGTDDNGNGQVDEGGVCGHDMAEFGGNTYQFIPAHSGFFFRDADPPFVDDTYNADQHGRAAVLRSNGQWVWAPENYGFRGVCESTVGGPIALP